MHRDKVDISMFSSFWSWFEATVSCLRASGIWSYTSPRLLHGFLSKSDTIRMLNGMTPGTFLLRCSESRRNCLVIAYVKGVASATTVQFVQVDYVNGIFQTIVSGECVQFLTMQRLVLRVQTLVWLYPGIAKEDAFV